MVYCSTACPLDRERLRRDDPQRRVARQPGRIAVVSSAEPYLTVDEPTFVARFLLDPQADTVETVANADVFVDFPTGHPGR
jgi:hypothetical protein